MVSMRTKIGYVFLATQLSYLICVAGFIAIGVYGMITHPPSPNTIDTGGLGGFTFIGLGFVSIFILGLPLSIMSLIPSMIAIRILETLNIASHMFTVLGAVALSFLTAVIYSMTIGKMNRLSILGHGGQNVDYILFWIYGFLFAGGLIAGEIYWRLLKRNLERRRAISVNSNSLPK